MNRRDGLATLLISMDIEQKQLATTKVAADCGVSERTVRKWLTRKARQAAPASCTSTTFTGRMLLSRDNRRSACLP
jgi:hypothetical protein